MPQEPTSDHLAKGQTAEPKSEKDDDAAPAQNRAERRAAARGKSKGKAQAASAVGKGDTNKTHFATKPAGGGPKFMRRKAS
ncbi:hypothetical protein [Natronoglycomyces albus]|uniref:Uncharacterized protein n=1 Tax=Natronoglycomyces albus TaxID=2811108 RepID=A0A895XNS1_9ACTN|nr:hypothetical protein [Natronoglycomyces albus]QSB04715.1 hypothetical protein JQS30_13190 [Natronoglycomyces albus]